MCFVGYLVCYMLWMEESCRKHGNDMMDGMRILHGMLVYVVALELVMSCMSSSNN